jgi:hypothetical protein
LFWTPVDLPAGWKQGADALSAGYHLYVDGEEVNLGVLLTMTNEIRD